MPRQTNDLNHACRKHTSRCDCAWVWCLCAYAGSNKTQAYFSMNVHEKSAHADKIITLTPKTSFIGNCLNAANVRLAARIIIETRVVMMMMMIPSAMYIYAAWCTRTKQRQPKRHQVQVCAHSLSRIELLVGSSSHYGCNSLFMMTRSTVVVTFVHACYLHIFI